MLLFFEDLSQENYQIASPSWFPAGRAGPTNGSAPLHPSLGGDLLPTVKAMSAVVVLVLNVFGHQRRYRAVPVLLSSRSVRESWKSGSPASSRRSAPIRLFPGDRCLGAPPGAGPEYLSQLFQKPAQVRPAPCCRGLHDGQQPGLDQDAGSRDLVTEFLGMDLVERTPRRLGLRPVQLRLAGPADRHLQPAPGQHCRGGLAATSAAPLGQAAGPLQLRTLGSVPHLCQPHENSPPVTFGINWCAQGCRPCNRRPQPLSPRLPGLMY